MQVRVLGALEVVTEAGVVAPASARQRAVLATLALAAGAPVSPDRLVDAVYGDHPPPSAHNSLQSHVARLRTALGGPGAIRRDPAGYRLAVAPDDVDAVRFERLLADARRRTGPDALAELDAALALWRGEPLADIESARGWAVRMTDLYRGARLDRAGLLIGAGRAAEAADELTDADPADERSTALRMRALAAAGRPADALALFRRHREILADSLGLDPSPELDEVHRSVLRGEYAAPPPAAVPPPVGAARGVPVRLSSFVGRDAECSRLGTLLDSPGLVSVTGPGGVGKTRLVAEAVRSRAAAGAAVSWVDVADVHGADDLARALAAGVGARPGPADDVLDAVAAAAAARPLLLVLDNCEHVAGPAAAAVERVLAAAPAGTVLVTSQERLRVDGERVLVLDPLPHPAGPPDAAQPAIRLFLDRAGDTVDPADPKQLAAVADVVTRLDALPLAIELAATQAGALGLTALRDRLDDRLELLSRGRRTGAPRHRTLRALLDWSYELLGPDERRVLGRLGVFAAGFTLELAERVLPDADLPAARVAPVLADLVDRSLVAREGPGRYRLLETLRAYARERTGDDAALAGRHAEAVVATAEQLDLELRGPGQAEAGRAMTALLPDLRQARGYTLATGAEDLLVRLAAAMHRYGYHGQWYEVLAWGYDAARTGSTHPRMPAALGAAAAHAWGRGDLDAARQLGERAVALAGPADAPAAREVLGDTALVAADGPAAQAHYAAMAVAGRDRGDLAMHADGLAGTALVLAWCDDVPAAVRVASEAMRLATASGNPASVATAGYTLGEALGDREPERALALLARAAEVAREVDDRLFEGAANAAAVAIGSRHGDPRPALVRFRGVLAHWRRTGNDTLQAAALRNLVVLFARVGADEAAALIDAALPPAALFPAEAARLARARAAVAERLGPPALAAVRDRAAAITAAELIDEATAALERAVAGSTFT